MKNDPTPRLAWSLACIFAASYAQADPMRPLIPPPAASAASPGSPGAAGASTAMAGLAAPPRTAEKETPRLVAIRQDSEQRWQALFGERWLKVGDRLDGATVAHIEGNLVQLAEGRQRRTLHLLPPLWRPGPPGSPGSPGSPADPTRAQSPGAPTELAQASPRGLPSNRAERLSTP